MPWWGWLLVALGVAGLVVLIVAAVYLFELSRWHKP